MPEAERERRRLGEGERNAVDNAIEKLRWFGPGLRMPHSSQVKGDDRLRELRPGQGRSRVRPLYRQVGEVVFVIAAIAPEVKVNRRGHERSVKQAEKRLSELEDDQGR